MKDDEARGGRLQMTVEQVRLPVAVANRGLAFSVSFLKKLAPPAIFEVLGNRHFHFRGQW